ncbi:MAG: hypothetical protein AB1898_30605 [Acidobacteriota bacterium]
MLQTVFKNLSILLGLDFKNAVPAPVAGFDLNRYGQVLERNLTPLEKTAGKPIHAKFDFILMGMDLE